MTCRNHAIIGSRIGMGGSFPIGEGIPNDHGGGRTWLGRAMTMPYSRDLLEGMIEVLESGASRRRALRA
jgi:hypothetical protein